MPALAARAKRWADIRFDGWRKVNRRHLNGVTSTRMRYQIPADACGGGGAIVHRPRSSDRSASLNAAPMWPPSMALVGPTKNGRDGYAQAGSGSTRRSPFINTRSCSANLDEATIRPARRQAPVGGVLGTAGREVSAAELLPLSRPRKRSSPEAYHLVDGAYPRLKKKKLATASGNALTDLQDMGRPAPLGRSRLKSVACPHQARQQRRCSGSRRAARRIATEGPNRLPERRAALR